MLKKKAKFLTILGQFSFDNKNQEISITIYHQMKAKFVLKKTRYKSPGCTK
ncbi:unnamed protein product [Staurois parvus]|uniref:Uncharacterized protein n=1 Tax=Staurois parvus TaxID=386267 RepID=A0ABN9DFJ0_9NEOB|nr:unnamed protein product [Staurois parvus]